MSPLAGIRPCRFCSCRVDEGEDEAASCEQHTLCFCWTTCSGGKNPLDGSPEHVVGADTFKIQSAAAGGHGLICWVL